MQKPTPPNNEPNEWICRYAELIPMSGLVLDLACGNGRHARMLAGMGHQVLAVDRDLGRASEQATHPRIRLLEAELESPDWPLAGKRFAGIVVVNYLYRPHLPQLINNLQDDGVVIYTTFAAGNEQFGRPRNPDFLLQPDELRRVFGAQLEVIDYEQLTTPGPKRAVRQQICATGPAFIDRGINTGQ
jgi:SAM-dependent methyltransferase